MESGGKIEIDGTEQLSHPSTRLPFRPSIHPSTPPHTEEDGQTDGMTGTAETDQRTFYSYLFIHSLLRSFISAWMDAGEGRGKEEQENKGGEEERKW